MRLTPELRRVLNLQKFLEPQPALDDHDLSVWATKLLNSSPITNFSTMDKFPSTPRANISAYHEVEQESSEFPAAAFFKYIHNSFEYEYAWIGVATLKRLTSFAPVWEKSSELTPLLIGRLATVPASNQTLSLCLQSVGWLNSSERFRTGTTIQDKLEMLMLILDVLVKIAQKHEFNLPFFMQLILNHQASLNFDNAR